MSTHKTAPAGSTILATMSSLNDQQTTIKTTSDVRFNEFHQKYYVDGFKVMKSSGRVSSVERTWCLIDFEISG